MRRRSSNVQEYSLAEIYVPSPWQTH